MNPILIVVIGMLVVVVGILALRLHAFLALVAGAMVVALLTPTALTERVLIDKAKLSRKAVASINAGSNNWTREVGTELPSQPTGSFVVLTKLDEGGFELRALLHELKEESNGVISDENPALGTVIQLSEIVLSLQDYKRAKATAGKSLIAHVATGFGNTAMKIGILIAMAAVIGMCLLQSGAAERIVRSALDFVGEKHASKALATSSFVLGVPVFFDTVFYLMIPLGRALRRTTKKNYTLYIVSIVAGGTMAHSLVPPTPGPLLVASELNVDVGMMMIGGGLLGLITVSVGLWYASWINRRLDIPLREDGLDDGVLADDDAGGEMLSDLNHAQRELPPLWLALLPIALPVLLIACRTACSMATKYFDEPADWVTNIKPTFDLLGDKNIALIIGAVIAMIMLVRQSHMTGTKLRSKVQKALESGGVIILITAAGGAFGHVLRQTDISGTIERIGVSAELGLLMLPIAFFITTIVRTAQGSATVAMITAGGVIAPIALPMVEAGTLSFHPLYLALAIGCGSKPISWMNDSGFWVIGKMSGMTEAETLKTSSSVMIVMAAVGLLVTMVAAWIMPMAPGATGSL